MQGIKQQITVSAEAIAGFYDYVPIDGTMPVDKLALANLWKELMAGVATIQQLMQTYDIGKIFAYPAHFSGAKNIGRFKYNVQSDAAIQAGVAAGNLVLAVGHNGPGTTESLGTSTGSAQSGSLQVTEQRRN